MLPNSFQRHRDRITSPCEDATPHLHWRLHVILTIEAAHANPARLLSFASESLQSHQQISWSNFLFGGGGSIPDLFFPPTLMHALTFQDYWRCNWAKCTDCWWRCWGQTGVRANVGKQRLLIAMQAFIPRQINAADVQNPEKTWWAKVKTRPVRFKRKRGFLKRNTFEAYLLQNMTVNMCG